MLKLFRRRDTGSEEFERTTRWGPTGWRGLDVPSAPQQNGVYGDAILNAYPAMWSAPLLLSGREGNYPGWQVLSSSSLPYWQQTVTPENVPGVQRYAGKPGQALGPLGARGLKEQVLRAQIQQSGMAAMSWAQQLKGWQN